MAFYDYARYYEIAFDFRDVRAEVDFLLGCYATFSGQERATSSALEVACGPGKHAREFARRGLRSVGLDLNATMLEYGRGRPYGSGVEWLRNDMRDFTLDVPVDLAYILTDSIVHVVNLDDMDRHLRSVAGSLTPGGLYVIEQSHPREAFADLESYAETEWIVEARGTRVEIAWGDDEDPFDPITQRGWTTVRMRVTENGQTLEIEEQLPAKSWLAPEMEAVIRASGVFELAQRYGAMDASIPFDNRPQARKMISVLRRR
ncbi:MAG TPA: class I SAM-dependent methyltransferase [Ardenticatenaceae bacterium]|nr:class I SAM-dependent methyltransferase [Ardenticatenaceae bacterium]